MYAKSEKGEITAFLSLIFLLLFSFAGGMVDVTSTQFLKNERHAKTNLAMESVFAEYHRELLEQYDIFALDGSYGADTFQEDKILNRLTYYGAREGETKIVRSELLTDQFGMPFYRQAVNYMKNKLGLDFLPEQDISDWEEQQEHAQNYEDVEAEVQQHMESTLEEGQESLPSTNNPLTSVEELRKSSLLQIVLEHPEELSQKHLQGEKLASMRELLHGKGDFPAQEEKAASAGKIMFDEYLCEHFSNFVNQKENHAMDYELEYFIGGSLSDQENLEIVLKKILAIRTGLNYTYLLTDEVKKAEAEALALSLCAILTVPGIAKIVQHAILLAWAYGEGIVDLRALTRGEKLAIVKSDQTWKLQLSELFRIGESDVGAGEQTEEQGIGYGDYLKGLLVLTKREKLTMRSLDLIEQNLNVRADYCVMRLETESICRLKRNITYDFRTYFGYQ